LPNGKFRGKSKMAKKLTIDTKVLELVGKATAEGGFAYVTKEQGLPLMQHNPPLIDINTAMTDGNGGAAARLTAAGFEMLKDATQSVADAPSAGGYKIIQGAALPTSKRGNRGGGAPTVYPFDNLEIGDTFFVPVSDKHKDPVKTLGSTVSSANMRYAVETGETEVVERAKRGKRNKLVLDDAGNKIMEKVERKKYNFTRKFSIRAVEAGKVYGSWTAPMDGAMIGRVQ
jgi:flagellin-like hook-associated protein FlgL